MVGEPRFTISPPGVDDSPAGDRALQDLIEDSGHVVEADVDPHGVEGHGLEVRCESLPDGAPSLDRRLDGVDPDKGDGTQHERHDGGGELYTARQAAVL